VRDDDGERVTERDGERLRVLETSDAPGDSDAERVLEAETRCDALDEPDKLANEDITALDEPDSVADEVARLVPVFVDVAVEEEEGEATPVSPSLSGDDSCATAAVTGTVRCA
jgi:hypothetical protein